MWNWEPEKDVNIQRAVRAYLSERNLMLSDDAEYEPVIDGVHILIDNNIVLRIGLPPVSNYNVRETEHTHKYLSAKKTVA